MTKMVLKLCKDLWEIIFHEVCASDLFDACIPEEDAYISKVFLEIFAVNSCKNSQSLASIFFSSKQPLRCISPAL